MRLKLTGNLALISILWLAVSTGCSTNSGNSSNDISPFKPSQNNVSPFRSSANENSPFKSSSPTPEQPALEYMLATIDEGYKVTDDNIKVKRLRYLLKALADRTGETQYDIANHTAQATSHAREDYGKDIKNLEIMEKAYSFYKETGSKEQYNYVLAAIVIQEAK